MSMRKLELQVAAERKEQKNARRLAAYYERKQANLARARTEQKSPWAECCEMMPLHMWMFYVLAFLGFFLAAYGIGTLQQYDQVVKIPSGESNPESWFLCTGPSCGHAGGPQWASSWL
jgi:hypothetical protein